MNSPQIPCLKPSKLCNCVTSVTNIKMASGKGFGVNFYNKYKACKAKVKRKASVLTQAESGTKEK